MKVEFIEATQTELDDAFNWCFLKELWGLLLVLWMVDHP